MSIAKAESSDLNGRFREIVSDPLNLLIHRVPKAGSVENGLVTLHNGLAVPLSGPGSYYGTFSNILVINRGVHEPLEEYCFQSLLKVLPNKPLMLELGAYWAHYSMWLKSQRPEAECYLVEPDAVNLEAGRSNFSRYGFEGQFFEQFVGAGHFELDTFTRSQEIRHIDILHADIQGYELELLKGGAEFLREGRVDYVFISTHSNLLHRGVIDALSQSGFRIEVESDVENHTTSFDGFVFASLSKLPRVLPEFRPLGRQDLSTCEPAKVIEYINRLSRPQC